jgi:stage IV sporulation protein FB
LPIFPLDGGRVVSAFLTNKLGSDKAYLTCKFIGGAFAILLMVAFVFTLFSKANLSLLFFSLFVLFGAFGRGRENKYIKIYSSLSEQKLMRGIPVKKIAVSKSITVKRLMSLLDENFLSEIAVYDNCKPLTTLSQEKIQKIIESGDIYSPIERFLSVK